MVAAEARVEMPLLKRGALEAWHTAAIRAAAERMSQAPLFIDETPSPSIDHIVARCRQQAKDTGLLLIVVDHLHLISLPEGTGAWSRRIAEVCLRLKAIARELGVPSLCLSELNRGPENRSDRRPMMWVLKNTGAVEMAADIIGFLYRDRTYQQQDTPDDRRGIAELIVVKNKSGRIETVELQFDALHRRFDDVNVETMASRESALHLLDLTAFAFVGAYRASASRCAPATAWRKALGFSTSTLAPKPSSQARKTRVSGMTTETTTLLSSLRTTCSLARGDSNTARSAPS